MPYGQVRHALLINLAMVIATTSIFSLRVHSNFTLTWMEISQPLAQVVMYGDEYPGPLLLLQHHTTL